MNGPGMENILCCGIENRTETEFSKIPGFYGAFELLHDSQDQSRYFLSMVHCGSHFSICI
jgi:hypothetical protein